MSRSSVSCPRFNEKMFLCCPPLIMPCLNSVPSLVTISLIPIRWSFTAMSKSLHTTLSPTKYLMALSRLAWLLLTSITSYIKFPSLLRSFPNLWFCYLSGTFSSTSTSLNKPFSLRNSVQYSAVLALSTTRNFRHLRRATLTAMSYCGLIDLMSSKSYPRYPLHLFLSSSRAWLTFVSCDRIYFSFSTSFNSNSFSRRAFSFNARSALLDSNSFLELLNF